MLRYASIVVGAFVVGVAVTLLLHTPAVPPSGTASIIAASTFDHDTEGWTVIDGATGPYHASQSGNPGGFMLANDAAELLWYWKAPKPFLGDQSAAYGGTFLFDLRQKITGNRKEAHDVVLIGAGLTLVFDLPFPPGKDWTTFAVRIHESAGWRKSGNGERPSAAEMQRVLAALTEIKIRGEYTDGDDVGSIDNVLLLRGP